MLSLDEIKEKLRDRNLAHIARETGISHMTIWKVKTCADGCSYRTLKILSEYFEANK